MASPSAEARRRPNRSAAARRDQYRRAEGRRIQDLLRAFEALAKHRGCATSRLGVAMHRLLSEDIPGDSVGAGVYGMHEAGQQPMSHSPAMADAWQHCVARSTYH